MVHVLLKEIKSQQRVEDKKLLLVEKELQSAISAFNEEVSAWSERLTSTCSHVCKESNNATTKQIGLLNQFISILQSLIGTISSEIQFYLKEEWDALMQLHDLTKSLAIDETNHLKQWQNDTLAKWVIDKQKSSEKAQADILQCFSGLLGEFFQKRNKSLWELIGNLQCSNMEVEDLLASTCKCQAKDQDQMINRNNELDHLQEFENQGHEAKKKSTQVSLSIPA